jgi:DNA-binding response OmpR family regulator
LHILYVEDNPNDAQLLQRYLNTTRHRLTLCHDLQSAATEIAEQQFDLILLDIMFGAERAGIELVRVLREQHYQQPIVALTALATNDDLSLLEEIGMSAVLVKPYQMQELATLIRHFETEGS